MSERALAWLSMVEPSQLSHAEYRLINVLAWLHNEERGYAWPSYNFLIKKTGLSRSGIAKSMASFEDRGMIERNQIDGESTHYIFKFPSNLGSSPSGLVDDDTSSLSGLGVVHSVDGGVVHPVDCNKNAFNNNMNKDITTDSPKSENTKRKKPLKSRLPEDWIPSQADVDYAYSKNLNDNDIKEIADDFHIYWTDRTDAGARKTSRGWVSTWQGQIRRIAWQYIKNRSVAGRSGTFGHGQGGGIAGAVARRQFGGQD